MSVESTEHLMVEGSWVSALFYHSSKCLKYQPIARGTSAVNWMFRRV